MTSQTSAKSQATTALATYLYQVCFFVFNTFFIIHKLPVYVPPKLKKTNIYKIISGKFKDEMGGKPIKEFIGLISKMYSILSEAGEQKNTERV